MKQIELRNCCNTKFVLHLKTRLSREISENRGKCSLLLRGSHIRALDSVCAVGSVCNAKFE